MLNMNVLQTYYLEMRARPDARIDTAARQYQLVECLRPQPMLNEFLYRLVGKAWDWTDRLDWSVDQWRGLVESSAHRIWVAYTEGVVAGYFELSKQGNDVELLYFGLSPEFIGEGIGKLLLEDAVYAAWDWQPVERVWVHTCNLDHPAALANYKRRGFVHYKTEEQQL